MIQFKGNYIFKSEICVGFSRREQFDRINKQVSAYNFYFPQETADHQDLS